MEQQLLEAVKNAQRCQRNWDFSKQVPQEHIDLLLKIARTTPTKQNKEYYQVAYTTDRDVIEDIYSLAYEPKDDPFWQKMNTQLRAQLLMMWFKWDEKMDDLSKGGDDFGETFDPKINHENTVMSVGICTGAVIMAANMLGYRTGFCQCMLPDAFRKYLLQEFGIEQEKVNGALLGIGIPRANEPHNKVFHDDGTVHWHKSISTVDPKNITVTRLQKTSK